MDGDRCSNNTWCPTKKEWLPNELVLWESLSHPNIVNLLEVYRDAEKNTWCFVMEYNLGFEDLFDYVDRNRSLPTRESADIIRQLVKVVYYLTLQNIDHRDLKDENILYNPVTKQIKLIDFGSSAKLSSEPYSMFRGTDVYIPPEFFLTGTYHSFQASVWAIGCIAYVLLSGDCPFQNRQSVKDFKSVEQLNPSYSERTLRLNFIRSCLNRNPHSRILLSDLIRHPWLRV
jgi:serine/threonine protein kinase